MGGLAAEKAEHNVKRGGSFGNGEEKVGEKGNPKFPGTKEPILLCAKGYCEIGKYVKQLENPGGNIKESEGRDVFLEWEEVRLVFSHHVGRSLGLDDLQRRHWE